MIRVSCLNCEQTCEQSELATLDEDEGTSEAWGVRAPYSRSLYACPNCSSTDIADVYFCMRCDQRQAAKGSDNCEECDEIVVPRETMKVTRTDDLMPLRVLREMRLRNMEMVAGWYARYLMETELPDIRGDITGPTIDQEYENKRRLARALMRDIQKHRRRAPSGAVPALLQRQAD